MKLYVTVTTLVIGISVLLGLPAISQSLAAPTEPVVQTRPLNPVLFEHRNSNELSNRLNAEHEAVLAAEAEAALLAEAESSEQLTYAQLQEYIRLYGCTPEQRRMIESGGDYGIDTGNGYLGAYQFSQQYVAGWWEQCFGTPYPGNDVFLSDPTAQDALADWYADNRYGGWDNVPATGGW